jgi:transposase
MARYKPYQYDEMVLVPLSFQDQLELGRFEYSLNELVEHYLDLSVYEARYQNDRSGARAIHPKLLRKVILFAYSRGIISSRQIERACNENVLFMALSGGCHPDHSTLAHFVSSMQKEIESLFATSCWSARNSICWEAHISAWMVSSCLPTLPRNGAEPSKS